MEENQSTLSEQKIREVLHAYHALFSSSFGKIVLEDMKKKYGRPISPAEFNSHGNLARRVAKREVIDDIETAIEAGSRLVTNNNIREIFEPEVELE